MIAARDLRGKVGIVRGGRARPGFDTTRVLSNAGAMHVKAIFAKMNVISRTEAVANATRCGLISFDATFLPV